MLGVVLYLNGGEGLATLNICLEHANVQAIVLPEGSDNTEIRTIASQQNIALLERTSKSEVNVQAYAGSTLISSAFPYKVYASECAPMRLAVNFHAAILPKYRGKHAGVWAMLNDEPELGVTVHEIDDGFDSGNILGIHRFPVADEMRLEDIQYQLTLAHKALLEGVLKGETLACSPKEEANIYWRQRNAADGMIQWHQGARQIFLLVRALARNPVYAWSRYNRHKFMFSEVQPAAGEAGVLAGTVMHRDGEILIACGDGEAVRVVTYHAEDAASQLKDGMVLH